MVTRRVVIAGLASPLVWQPAFAGEREPSFFQAQVDAGTLPPVAQRLPTNPRVVNLAAMGRVPGRHGGDIRMLIGGQRDIRLMTINGYARLVGFSQKLELQADILESFETVEDRIFTFKIRAGHKWSDGSPLTAEDFRYCWEDVHLNEELSPGGLSTYLLSHGKPPVFEIIDTLTVRYSWDAPNSDFLPQIAAAQPLSMVMPSAYLKTFHM
jgi:peptide/nickel transport system substrate-binding protein